MDLNAVATVQTVSDILSLGVDFVQDHVCVGLVTGCECDDLVELAHAFEESNGIRPYGDVGVGSGSVFYFDGELEIVGPVGFFLTVQDSFIDIDDECLFADVVLIDGKLDLLLFYFCEGGRLDFKVVFEDFQRNVQVVECSFVLAFQSSDEVVEVVGLYLRALAKVYLALCDP